MRRFRIPTWTVVLVVAILIGLGLAYAVYEVGFWRDDLTVVRPTGTAPTGPETLSVGAVAPALEAEGWLNGQPPARVVGGPKVIVADIWALW